MIPAKHIVRHEFHLLFRTPIGWLTIALFVAISTTHFIRQFEGVQQIYLIGERFPPATWWVFMNPFGGLFIELRDELLFFIPLLTMGVFTREKALGSMTLLTSSPQKLSSLVTSKYLALLLFVVLLFLFLSFLSVIASIFIVDIEWGLVAAGLLGLLLLGLSYLAIGMFISSITRYQVVAALMTLAVLYVLGNIGVWGQSIPLLSDGLSWLAITDRVRYLFRGLITSSDVFYFLALATFFLLLTFLRLESQRRGWSSKRTVGIAGVLLIGTVTAGQLLSLKSTTVYIDATQNARNTLSAESRQIVSALYGRLIIDVYANVLDAQAQRFLPKWRAQDERLMFDQYTRFKPDIEVNYHWYFAPSENHRLFGRFPDKSYSELAQNWAIMYGIDFDVVLDVTELPHLPFLRANDYRAGYRLRLGGRESYIRTFEGRRHIPEEPEISAGLKRLLIGGRVIAFVGGNGERSPIAAGSESYADFFGRTSARHALVNHGFDVRVVDLGAPISADVDTLFVAGPRRPYSTEEIRVLRDYMDRGGDMVILGGPETMRILRPLIDALGTELVEARLVNDLAAENGSFTVTSFDGEAASFGIGTRRTNSEAEVVFSDPQLFRIADVTGDNPFDAVGVLRPVAGQGTSASVALRRTLGDEEQRILLVGDEDAFSTSIISSREVDASGNLHLLHSTMRWVTDGAYPVHVQRASTTDNALRVEPGTIQATRTLLQWILPLSVVGFGLAYLLLRSRN